MKRETFIAILSAALAEADEADVSEAKGLLFWRERELRAEAIKAYRPGELIVYVLPNGEQKLGRIHHLNRFSVTVHQPDDEQGYRPTVVPLERIKTTAERNLDGTPVNPASQSGESANRPEDFEMDFTAAEHHVINSLIPKEEL